MEYGDLRRDLHASRLADTSSPRRAIEPAPAAASGGFDWLSAAIGAAVAAAQALLSWTALGMRRTVGGRAAGA